MPDAKPPVGNRPGVAVRLTSQLKSKISARLSPEHTRAATLSERLTVSKLSWEWIVRLNRYLEFFGKVTTVVYVGFVASVIFGVDWKDVVAHTFNSGAPVKGAVTLAFVLPTLLFVALHSLIGYGRWRLQRELWRRDVERLSELADQT